MQPTVRYRMPVIPRPANHTNVVLATLFMTAQGVSLGTIPLLLPRNPAWGWLLVLPVLLTNGWWSLMHEAIHGQLFSDRPANRLAGRVNGILFGAPFDLLRRGHLLHHTASRTPADRSEVFAPQQEKRMAFTLAYYFRLLGGLYLMEITGGLIFLLPRTTVQRLAGRLARPDNLIGRLTQPLLEPATLTDMRTDAAAALALYLGEFLLWGHFGWMLLLALWGRGLLISLMDNVFHYGTPLNDTRYARNLHLPPWASGLILHFNLHGVHHGKASVPWHALPEWHRREGGEWQGGFFDALTAQLRGPIAETALPQAQPVRATR